LEIAVEAKLELDALPKCRLLATFICLIR